MDFAMFIYVALCIAISLMAVEDITRKGLRWTIADLLKFTLLLCVLLALGRVLASV